MTADRRGTLLLFLRHAWRQLPPAVRSVLMPLAWRTRVRLDRTRESRPERERGVPAARAHVLIPIAPPPVAPGTPARPEPGPTGTGPPPAGPLAVAVVVPAYNSGAWLSDCLESVRRQTYDAWRCYVVDDASADETAAIASSFAARDSRFVVLRHGRNAGLSAARNTGLAHAEEPLVTFLDADDLLTVSSLRRREAVLRRHWGDPAVAGAWGDVHPVGQAVAVADSAAFDRDCPRKPTIHACSHEGECPFNVHAPLLRAEILRRLGGFDERLRRGAEDWDLWHRLLRHGYTVEYAGGSAGLYRRRPQSMSSDVQGHLDQSFQLLATSERRARVDERLVVDPHAAVPLARSRLAARWLRRVATYEGMRLAAGGDRNTTHLDELSRYIRGAPRALTADLEQHVAGGLRRGFCIAGSARLPEPEAARIGEIARAVAEEIRTAAASAPREDEDEAPPVVVSPLQAEPDVVVVAETAADVRSLAGFVRRLRARGWDAVALDADYARGDQGATEAWRRTDVPLVPCNHLRFGRVRAARMLVCRPFGPLTAELAAAVRGAGGVVVEWSEGVAEARLPCNDTESTSCDGRWTADTQVPEKEAGASLEPVAGRAGRTDAGTFPGPATHCLDIVREEGALDHESTALLESLRDRHRGETVVVIGNGPSLNDTDLGLLTGVATIGVNGIFYAQDRLPEPLTYYVVEDTSVFRENTAAIKAFACGCKLFPTLYRPAFADDEIDRARTGFFRMNMGFYGRGTRTLCLPRFSTDAVQRLYCGQSVTIINLQLAWWMGFSRVVLIGMDFSYTIPQDADRQGNLIRSNSDDVNHFHPDYFGKGKTWKDPKLDRVLASYALAREMFAADGREIVNATVGGRLEVFRRMPLARALSEAPPPPRARPAGAAAAAVPVPESRENAGSVAPVAARRPSGHASGTKRRAVSNAGAASGKVAGGVMKKIGHLRKRLPVPTVAVMALGLILTGAGFSGGASRWWIGASGLLLVGLAGAKESILWRWRREQLREELAGQQRRAEQALAAERQRAEAAAAAALSAERQRTEQALAAERQRAEAAAAAALSAERQRTEQALATERSRRSLVDAHLADRGLSVRRILLLFTIDRSGSTWLFDMLRTHPAVRTEPTARVWTELGLDGRRYPYAFHHVDGARVPLEVMPDLGAAIPDFPQAAVPDTRHVDESDRWAVEKAHPQFVGFSAARLGGRIRALRGRGVDVEVVYGVRGPLDAMWSMAEYKARDPKWYSFLPLEEVPRYLAHSLDALAALHALVGGTVVEYETLPDGAAMSTLCRRIDPSWSDAAVKAWLAHAAAVTERSKRRQRSDSAFLGDRNRLRNPDGPDRAWVPHAAAIEAANAAWARLADPRTDGDPEDRREK